MYTAAGPMRLAGRSLLKSTLSLSIFSQRTTRPTRMVSAPYMLSSSVSLSLSTSSTPDSNSPSFKEGSSDSVKMKELLQEPKMSAATSVGSLSVSNESAGLSSTGTALEPMDIARAERIAYLEETTKNNHSDLRGLTKKMELLADKRQALLNKTEELTAKEERRLKVIEEEDLPDMRKDKERLVAEIAEFKKELSELRNAGTTDVKRSGIYLSIYQQQQQQQQQQQ